MFPISLDLGFNFFPFYEGLYFLTAILTAAFWAMRRWKKSGLDPDSFYTFLYAGLGGAILGGRLSHFLFWDMERLIEDPLGFFRFWEGGISVSGGLAMGVLAAFLACRVKKIDFWKVLEACSPAVLLGQAIGRIGCFLNGDAFGKPTSLPWGVSFPRFATVLFSFKKDTRYSSHAWAWCYERGLVGASSRFSLRMHPTQLYEMGLDLVLLGLLLFLMRRAEGRAKGKLGFLFLAGGYALVRFLLEFLRADNDGAVLWGMTAFQLALALAAAACAIAAPFLLGKRKAAG